MSGAVRDHRRCRRQPKPRSRTRAAAELVVERLTGAQADVVIDVIDLGPGLLGWGDPGVEQAVATLRGEELAVVASPTYKATYTGLLKLFLDHVGTGDLAGVTLGLSRATDVVGGFAAWAAAGLPTR